MDVVYNNNCRQSRWTYGCRNYSHSWTTHLQRQSTCATPWGHETRNCNYKIDSLVIGFCCWIEQIPALLNDWKLTLYVTLPLTIWSDDTKNCFSWSLKKCQRFFWSVWSCRLLLIHQRILNKILLQLFRLIFWAVQIFQENKPNSFFFR